VETVLCQTMQDFELLLIDDGSSDTTLEICKTFQQRDPRIKVFTHPNQGVSYSRNRGIEEAKADALVFIDGDDYVKPDFLERLYEAFEEGVWPICGMINVRKGKELDNEKYALLLGRFSSGKIGHEELLYLLKYDTYNSPCARIYSKSIIRQHQLEFDASISYQEDLMFNIAYSQYINEVICLPYFGYYYIEHTSSSSSRYHKNFDHLEILLQKFIPMIKNPEQEEILKEFMFQAVLKKIANLFHPGSAWSDKKKYQELKTLINSDVYHFMHSYISQSRVNPVQKALLRFKTPLFLFCYFKILH